MLPRYGSDARPHCWEEVRDKYVPIFRKMKGDADASSLLSDFEGCLRFLQNPVRRALSSACTISTRARHHTTHVTAPQPVTASPRELLERVKALGLTHSELRRLWCKYAER